MKAHALAVALINAFVFSANAADPAANAAMGVEEPALQRKKLQQNGRMMASL